MRLQWAALSLAQLARLTHSIKTNYTFQSQGETIACDLYLPSDLPSSSSSSGGGGIPIAVAGPGFPAVKELFFPPFGAALAADGIALLVFDYIGFGASSGAQRQDVVIDAQHAVYSDALSVVSRDARFSAARMGVFGKSLSGAHALYLAATDNRVRAAVAIVPHIGANLEAFSQRVPFGAAIAADLLAKTVGGARTMVPVYGPPGARAVMTSDGAQEYLSEKSRGTTYRNECTASSMAQIGTYDVSSRARTIKVPVVAVAAAQDKITPAKSIHQALDEVRSAKVYDFPGEHFTMAEANMKALVDITVQHFKKYL